MRDAESHAEEDKKRREEIETRNRADQAVYAAEKMLQEMGDKLAAGDKAAVESAVAALKSALEVNDTAAMTQAMEQLTQAQHKAAEAIYKQAGPSAPGDAGPDGAGPSADAAGGGQPGGGAGDVIDAEVVEDDKR